MTKFDVRFKDANNADTIIEVDAVGPYRARQDAIALYFAHVPSEPPFKVVYIREHETQADAAVA